MGMETSNLLYQSKHEQPKIAMSNIHTQCTKQVEENK